MTFNLNVKNPAPVPEAVDRLIAELPLKDKATMANMTEDELGILHPSLGTYIRDNYGPALCLVGNHWF
ncbi:MAG: hypothetical protein Q8P24_05940 [Desulfobacterales bacterium]|nr:hypothetical protein [Desulfobacterales bacterium]